MPAPLPAGRGRGSTPPCDIPSDTIRRKRMSAARHTFLANPIAAIALIALAQWLYYDRWWGATLGGFSLAWIVAFVVARCDVRRCGPALPAHVGAVALGCGLVGGLAPLRGLLVWST